MGVRPNIQSLVLDGTELTVRGESDTPLPEVIHVVVVQGGGVDAGRAVGRGIAERVGTGWRATLTDTPFKTGPAETLGIEIHVQPFEVRSWVQSVTID